MSDPRTIHDETTSDDEALPSTAQVSLDRMSSFLLVFGAIMLFLAFYLITVLIVEEHLQLRFEKIVAESIRVRVSPRPPGESIRLNLIESVENSHWVRFWGVKVDVVVLGRDDANWLYVNGQIRTLRYPNRDPKIMTAIHAKLLPATATVGTSIGHNTMLSNSILIVYATILFTGLFVYNRHVAGLQDKALDEARESRDQAASTAGRIQKEIDSIRMQLREVEPAKQKHREEIARLRSEQQELRAKLVILAAREHELCGHADRAAALEEDGRALEGLLEEATRDLGAKNAKIRELEKSLKRVPKNAGAAGGKSRGSELLAKRMRTLYPNLEIDERAIDDMIALQDETTKLRAEECIKRLGEDADNVGVRRKVGGLPNHLSIYELAFAAKRRVYYAKVQNGRFRVLVIGAKKTQQRDLDYLARIPKGELIS
jgi:hypothetical protein